MRIFSWAITQKPPSRSICCWGARGGAGLPSRIRSGLGRPSRRRRQPIFLANADSVPQFLDAERKQIDKLDEEFILKAVELQKKLAVTEKLAEGAPVQVQAVEKTGIELQAAQDQIDEANRRLREIRMFLVQFGLGGALLTLLFLGFYLISVGLRQLSEGGNPRNWLISGLTLLGLLFFISVVGTFALMGEPMDDFGFQRERAFKFGAAPNAPMAGGLMLPQAPPGVAVAVPENEMLIGDEVDAAPVPEPVNPIANFGNKKQPQLFQDRQNQQFGNNGNPGLRVTRTETRPRPPRRRSAGRLTSASCANRATTRRLCRSISAGGVQLPPVHDLCVVREYAHRHNPEPDGVRRDFTETLCWQPVLVMPDGKGQVQFDLSDSVTRFQVLVLSHTLDGRLGSNIAEITAKLPFTVEPKTPIEVTQSDQIGIPVAVRNDLAKKTSVQLSARIKGLELQENAEPQPGARAEPDEAHHVARQADDQRRDRVRARNGQDRRAWRRRRTQIQSRAGRLPGRRLAQRRPGKRPDRARNQPPRWPTARLLEGAGPLLPLPRGRAARRAGSDSARAGRLLRAKFVEQLSQYADSQLPETNARSQSGA